MYDHLFMSSGTICTTKSAATDKEAGIDAAAATVKSRRVGVVVEGMHSQVVFMHYLVSVVTEKIVHDYYCGERSQ